MHENILVYVFETYIYIYILKYLRMFDLQITNYGSFDTSSGVMLMNLTRMRDNSRVNWIEETMNIYDQFKLVIDKIVDQDILNIFFNRVRNKYTIKMFSVHAPRVT